MKTTSQILSEEHQNILKAIDMLLKECNDLEKGKEIDLDFFNRAIEFIRGYADRFHHAKEEDILFVALAGDNIEMRCNPTEQMIYEHGLGRNFIKELEIGVNNKNKDKIIKNSRSYAQLLQEHIFKEDNILYPMADKALTKDIEKAMLGKFKEVEQKFAKQKEDYLSFIKA